MERTLALALCQHCAVIMGWMKVREKGSIIIGEGRGEGQKRETIGTGHHHCWLRKRMMERARTEGKGEDKDKDGNRTSLLSVEGEDKDTRARYCTWITWGRMGEVGEDKRNNRTMRTIYTLCCCFSVPTWWGCGWWGGDGDSDDVLCCIVPLGCWLRIMCVKDWAFSKSVKKSISEPQLTMLNNKPTSPPHRYG